MANEAQLRVSLSIRTGNLSYQSSPTAFLGDVIGSKGPTPGAISVSTAGTQVDLSQLTTPGYYRFANLDETNYVEYGIYDPQTHVFYPFGEILPGESYVGRFSRNVQEEYLGPGTGTHAGTESNRLMFLAHGASVNVLVEAFEA